MNVAELDAKLNALILEGAFLQAFDAFCHEEVEMRENDSPPITGFGANRVREEKFASAIGTVNEVSLLSAAVVGDVSFSEWVIDCTLKDGTRVRLEQVAVRRWRDGKVIAERFYYDPQVIRRQLPPT
jgi:ketosteroid isomerase-like protein